MTKKIIMVDMDGVLCNFRGAFERGVNDNPGQKYPQSKWGFFLKLKEMPNAITSFNRLKEHYDIWILTRPSFKNVNSYSEKAQWVWDNLGYDILEKTIMCGDKSLVKGDYLIDDQNGAGQDRFGGEWIHFGSDKYPDWESVLDYLLPNND